MLRANNVKKETQIALRLITAISVGPTLEESLADSVAAFILLASLSACHCHQPGLMSSLLGGCVDPDTCAVGP